MKTAIITLFWISSVSENDWEKLLFSVLFHFEKLTRFQNFY